jgi:branched-chain amino acid transport system ATP-binding protein
MALLARVGLEGFARLTAGELAYGRKRTLEIATTLAMEPELMLLDEPTAGNGPRGRGPRSRPDQGSRRGAHGAHGRAQHERRFGHLRHDHGPAARLGAGRGAVRRGGEEPAGHRGVHGDGKCRDILAVKDLHAWYGESHVLHGVDFAVRKGEVVTLLGRNGAGRTSTLKSILGLVGRRTGSIVVNGVETIGLPTYRSRTSGSAIVPRSAASSRACRSREPDPAAEGGRGRHERGRDLRDVPEPARAPEDRAGHALSGGEQQMLAMARILRSGAQLLLLDEITEGLAPVIVQALGA